MARWDRCCCTPPGRVQERELRAREMRTSCDDSDRSVELPSEVESEKQRVSGATARNLRERRAEGISEREREHVAANALLETEAERRLIGRVAGDTRHDLGGHRRASTDANPRTHADE